MEAQSINVISATEARIQALRFKPGTLDSLKAVNLKNLEDELK